MTRLGLIEGTVVLAWCVEAAILVGWGLLVRELVRIVRWWYLA
jgi:hypothetical protein